MVVAALDKSVRRAVLVACTVLVAPGFAHAQSAIAGQVTDGTGAVLPGVTVDVSSPALIEGARVGVTDGQGRYAIDGLRPGTYKVTFSLAGFSTAVREGIELVANFTAPVSIQMRVGAIEESISVAGETPLVDVQRTATQQVLSREVLDVLPTGRNAWVQAAMLPGSRTSVDVGGLSGGTQGTVSYQGSLAGDMTFQADGMNLASGNITGQTTSAYSDNGTVQELAVTAVAGTAEQQASGVVVNMIMKDGGNTVKASGLALYSDSNLYSSNYSADLKARGLPDPGQMLKLWDFNLGLGGPIQRDKLWFFGSTRWWGSNKVYPDTFSQPGVQSPGSYEFDIKMSAELVRLTAALTPKNKLVGYFTWIPRTRPHIPVVTGNFVPAVATNATFQSVTPTPYQLQAKWTSIMTNKALLEVGFQQNHYRYTATYQDDVPQTAIMHQDVVRGTQWNAALYDFDSVAQFQAVVGKFSYVTGSHSFKTGIEYNRAYTRIGYQMHGDLWQQYSNGVPFQVAAYNTPVEPGPRNELHPAVGLFAQDAWTMHRVTVNGGVRFDYMQQLVPPQTAAAGTFVPVRNFAGVSLPAWRNWVPRLGVAYDLFGNAKTAVKFNAGRYVMQDAASTVSAYNPLGLQSDLRTWTDRNGNDIAEPDEIGPSRNSNFGLPLGTRAPAPNLARPYNDLYNITIEHQFLPRMSVSAGYYHRVFRNLIWTNNLLTNFDSYTEIDIQNPYSPAEMLPVYNLKPAFLGLVQNVDQNSTDNRTVYNGYEVGVSARFGKGGALLAGLASGLTRNQICQVADPNKLRFCDESRYDIPWNTQGKISGAYPLPWDVTTSIVFQSLPGSARTLSYTVTRAQVPALTLSSVTVGPTTSNPSPGLNAPGTLYYPRLNQLDLKFSKSLRYRNTKIVPELGIFNATNSATVLSQNNAFGPLLNQVQTVLDGRVVRFGVQIDF